MKNAKFRNGVFDRTCVVNGSRNYSPRENRREGFPFERERKEKSVDIGLWVADYGGRVCRRRKKPRWNLTNQRFTGVVPVPLEYPESRHCNPQHPPMPRVSDRFRGHVWPQFLLLRAGLVDASHRTILTVILCRLKVEC